MSNGQPTGTWKFSSSNGCTEECGTAYRLSLAKEIPELRYSRQVRRQNRKRQRTARSECFTWLFARTGKIFSQRSANSKSAESNSNSKTTKSHTLFISATPMATSSRSRLMNWTDVHRECVF